MSLVAGQGGSHGPADEAARWAEALEARTVLLPSSQLDDAVKFLEQAQQGQAWGMYPGTEFHRHSSALAMAALRTAADSWVIGESTVFFLGKYREQIKGLGVDPLIDVIELLRGALPDDRELRKAVSRRVKEHVGVLVREEGMGTTSRLADLVSAAWSAEVIESSDAEKAWQRLIDTQNKDGSWSPVSEGGGVLATTAAALRALSQATLGSGLGVRHDAFRYIAEKIREISKEDELDVFVIATTMIAISNYDECDYWLIAKLEDWLLSRQGEDGGWPDNQGAPSTVEHTALAVLALTAAGARSHVPTRLARAALEHARSQMGDLEEERDRLQREFEEAVKKRCGGLMSENESLKKTLQKTEKDAGKIASLEDQVSHLRRVAEPVAYSSELLADTPPRLRDHLAFVLATAISLTGLIVGLLSVADVIAPPISAAVASLVTALAVATVAAVAAEVWRQRNRRVLRQISTLAEQANMQWIPFEERGSLDERLRSLRLEFARISDGYPPGVRQELVYVLFDRFVDPPADVAARLAEQAGFGLGLMTEDVWQFRRWVQAAALLEPHERKVLFDQIRRLVRL